MNFYDSLHFFDLSVEAVYQMKKDDSSLPKNIRLAVRKQALLALQKADAIGVFPTPVDQILDIAEVMLAPEAVFSDGFLNKLKRKYEEVGDRIKKALSKVRGLFDATARIIYVDKSLHIAKRCFLKLHETGHAFLPWQAKSYALVEDCEKTLDPDIADQFDREANVFAKEVLFQLDAFSKEASEHNHCIGTPISLSKKYGASIYSSIREYVRSHHLACTVLVLNQPKFVDGGGFISTLRRHESSLKFLNMFGEPNWPLEFSPDDSIGAIVPIYRGSSHPRHLSIIDSNGIEHECLAEAFNNSYQIFVLITPVSALTSKTFIIPPF